MYCLKKMPPKDSRNIYIGAKYDLNDVIKTPSLVLQMMSMRIMNRREEELEKMINKKICYFCPDGTLHEGIVLEFNMNNGVRIKKSNGSVQDVSIQQLVLM